MNDNSTEQHFSMTLHSITDDEKTKTAEVCLKDKYTSFSHLFLLTKFNLAQTLKKLIFESMWKSDNDNHIIS